MGRLKHRLGRAGTWLEVKVRNRQRYLYERTRVYQGGKSHITSKYLYKLPPAEPEPVEEPQATAQTPLTGTPIMLSNQNRYRAPPAGGEETGRFATRGRQIPPPVVLRGDKHEAKSLNEGHLASEKK